jgi:peptidoglycan hydrolase-like protein with peptidoglycan-binding domain
MSIETYWTVVLQARLQELGYLRATAKIDGVYGPVTRAAIIAWQTAVQLPATGLFGDSDALRLQEAATIRRT